MKKWISFLTGILILGFLAVPGRAAETARMTIAASKEAVKPGEEVTFTVSVAGSEACRTFGLMLNVDEAAFEVVQGECTVKGAILSVFDEERGFAVLYGSETVPDGTVGTFVLRVKDGAQPGTAAVSGSASMRNGDAVIACDVSGANVTVSAEAPASDTAPAAVPTESAAAEATQVTQVQTAPAISGQVVPAERPAEETTRAAGPAPETEGPSGGILGLLPAAAIAAAVSLLLRKKKA